MRRHAWWLGLLCGLLCAASAVTAPLRPAARARLAAGQSLQVVVEFETRAIDQAAAQERTRRRLSRDDAAVRAQRVQGYANIKTGVEAAAAGADAARLRDYPGLPLALWRVDSPAALARLQSHPGVRAVHEDRLLQVNSVSDLAFIHQPEVVAEGAAGAGTVVAVIDGGLVSNYTSYSDFGTCTDINQPTTTCRVLYLKNYNSGTNASHEAAHGTNVSAIALGVAPGAKLAMYNVFGWFFDPATQAFVSGARTSDIVAAIGDVVSRFNASTYNVAAVNMSLGDASAHATTCTDSAFASAIAQLNNLGIAAVVAAGNSGAKNGLADPACAPAVVSVGAVYSQSHGGVLWSPPASCTESGVADQVACFSQSADYLTVLAPGLFVDAPDASFELSGTSQAAPHVAGALAILRARYPAEPLSQSVQRMRDTGHVDADALAGGRATPRLDLLAALHEAARLDLSATGPVQAVNGQTGNFELSVKNTGALTGTGLSVRLSLPAGTTVLSMSAGCTVAGTVVTCTQASLAPGGTAAFSVQVLWNYSGAVAGSVQLLSDQLNSSSSQQLVLGPAASPGAYGDAPLPLWAELLLAMVLLAGLLRAERATRLRPVHR